jgi:hypothetical protein
MPRNPPHLSRPHSPSRCGRSRRAGSISWSKPANDPGIAPGETIPQLRKDRYLRDPPPKNSRSIRDTEATSDPRKTSWKLWNWGRCIAPSRVANTRSPWMAGERCGAPEHARPRRARSVKGALVWAVCGDLQPLPIPGALDPSVADRPTRLVQQSCNLAIAVAAIVAGQRNDVGRQPFAILTAPRDLALRRAVLPERRTGAALGNVVRTLIWSAATTKDFATI